MSLVVQLLGLDMELQQLVAATVNTFDKNVGDIKVSIALQDDNTVLGEDVKKKVCQIIGLKQSSHDLFSLFTCNSNGEILQRVRDTDHIFCPVKGLVLRKWCFTQKQESEVIKNDGMACHLVFSEAENDIKSERLVPNKEQEQKLEEYLEPGFTLEEQYVYVCQSMKDYFSIRVDNCTMSLKSEEEFTPLSLSEQLVSVMLSSEGVVVATGQHAVIIPLFCVRSWSINTVSSLIQYKYKSSADQDVTLSLGSNQFRYLHAGTMEAIKDFRLVSVMLSSEGVVVATGQHAVIIPLFCVRSWSINTVSSLIQYKYKSSADQDVTLSLGSNQFRYLHAGTMEAIKDFRVSTKF
ncbi:uncharacterized protein LOC110447982 [Mizuhopecten yessoensis]|uniref:uncharacterized protein LOC110447982 n=1 Tax=Mizuhopecten yessoensis TaxID=6573 RepID=UPI000B45EC68|nr:uncharacterized protein LOC110447982 [Mizuhopecten yessoensis]